MRARDHRYFEGPFVAMAHRGGARLPANLGRENTLAAFQEAVALGYRWIETDVHVTLDGGLVAFHDPTLDRVGDRAGALAELSLDEVQRVDVGGERIPTLDEVLEEFPDIRINIDIKAPGAEEPLWRCLARHRAEDRVCVGSFSQTRLQRFRAMSRGLVATACGPLGTVATVAAARAGVGIAPMGAAFQVPVRHRVAGVVVDIVTPAFVAQAHRWGKQVHVWTIDAPDEMHRLIDWGVDGLVTDRPDLLKQVLVERGLWEA